MSLLTTGGSGVRVRFAPAPTGHLHVGSLRTALFNWMFARHHGGTYLLRIEDTDLERSKTEYTESIITSLTWADLLPDEPFVIQTHRDAQHRHVIEQLLAQGKAYRCYCSPQELAVRCTKATNEQDELFFSYDGFCRRRQDAHRTGTYVVRFALPDNNEPIFFDDLIKGRITFERSYFDDFIIARSDGRPMYNFVVVVDDAFMRITHIIRGEDHIANTPKQILLYQACGYQVPQFAHLPMILGPGGHRLSKRDGAVAVLDYQKDGYLPDAFENYLIRLGWSHGDQEIFSRAEVVNYFLLENVGKKGAIFDIAKLAWVNSMYIKHKSDAELLAYIQRYLAPALRTEVGWDMQTLCQVIGLYKDRVKTIRELLDEILALWHGPSLFDVPQLKTTLHNQVVQHLDTMLTALMPHEIIWQAADLKLIMQQCASTCGIKFVDLAGPVRVALIGKSTGPGVSELLALVGKREALRRIMMLKSALL